jgi:hypothetical protein
MIEIRPEPQPTSAIILPSWIASWRTISLHSKLLQAIVLGIQLFNNALNGIALSAERKDARDANDNAKHDSMTSDLPDRFLTIERGIDDKHPLG